MELFPTSFVSFEHIVGSKSGLDVSTKRVKMCVPQCLPQLILRSFMRKELRKLIELFEQKMLKSPNNMKDSESHFLYRMERMIRFKMLQKNMP